ncbi:hypothetical protein RIF29_20253 [Crotalaria pallida]|uniref:Uncharacterized protein n=1 Tax=Crotalaria pallida TaxID=3830 RepID=A0AAN9F341_CROPI
MGTYSFESAENKQVMIAASTKEDHTWSIKKIEGDEGLNLNTVECLRGRLLAERQASRVAKEDAESMGSKLVELEKLLRQEIKLRDKAERKLNFLKKKLESLNAPSMSGQSEHSDSSEKCENSSGSSSIISISKYPQANEAKHHIKNVALNENAVVHNQSVSEDCDSHVTDNSSCNLDPGYSFPQILIKNPNPRSEDLKNDESRHSSLSSKSSVTDDDEDHNGNSLP